MPGTDGCVRCGSSLHAATLVMDVRPPRAGKLAKRWRRAMPNLTRTQTHVGRLIRFGADCLSPARSRLVITQWPLVWRSVLPGWAHWHAGRRDRGRWFITAFCTLGAFGVLFYGRTLGSIFSGLAIAVHVSAIFDLINQYEPPRINVFGIAFDCPAWLVSLAVMMAVLLVLYAPIAGAIMQVAAPVEVTQSFEALQAGQVVLVNQRLGPGDQLQDGQLVLFNSSTYRVLNPFLHETVVNSNQSIGRILAGGGDMLTCVGGRVYVNGRQCLWQPSQPISLPSAEPVSEGMFVLLWNGTDERGTAVGATIAPELLRIPRDQIDGRIYWRYQPIWKFGSIR
jgi:hypothetical protein